MKALGVEPGIAWAAVAGQRQLIVEREFDTLASHEADDAAFHGGEESMAPWRKLESTAESTEAEIWQTSPPGKRPARPGPGEPESGNFAPAPARTGGGHT
jgi:hypothetical protein